MAEREARVLAVFPSAETLTNSATMTTATVRVRETMHSPLVLAAQLGAKAIRIGPERGHWARIVVEWPGQG